MVATQHNAAFDELPHFCIQAAEFAELKRLPVQVIQHASRFIEYFANMRDENTRFYETTTATNKHHC